MEELAAAATVADGAGTTVAPEKREFDSCEPSTENGQNEGLDEAAGGVPIDENLFADEDDLDDLEEDLEDLDVND